jgi:hypothetical protein
MISTTNTTFTHLLFANQANKHRITIGQMAKINSSIDDGIPSGGVSGEIKPTANSKSAARFTRIINIVFVLFIRKKRFFRVVSKVKYYLFFSLLRDQFFYSALRIPQSTLVRTTSRPLPRPPRCRSCLSAQPRCPRLLPAC